MRSTRPPAAREDSAPVGSADLSYLAAALLGLVQGLSEFLPISSSGHLALAERLGLGGALPLAFDVTVHVATLLVVVQAFWKDFLDFWRRDPIVVGYLVIGSIPAAFCGLLLKDCFDNLRHAPLAVSAALLLTAGVLVAAERIAPKAILLRRLGLGGSLIVGLAQALALTPGISRSGWTIAGGLLCGLEKDDAIKFSFLLMVPAVGGAAILTAVKDHEALLAIPFGPLLLGFTAALVSGFFALRILIAAVRGRRLSWFAAYLALVGLASLIGFGFLGK